MSSLWSLSKRQKKIKLNRLSQENHLKKNSRIWSINTLIPLWLTWKQWIMRSLIGRKKLNNLQPNWTTALQRQKQLSLNFRTKNLRSNHHEVFAFWLLKWLKTISVKTSGMKLGINLILLWEPLLKNIEPNTIGSLDKNWTQWNTIFLKRK